MDFNNATIPLGFCLEMARQQPDYDHAYPILEMIKDAYVGTPQWREVLQEVNAVKMAFRPSYALGAVASLQNLPPKDEGSQVQAVIREVGPQKLPLAVVGRIKCDERLSALFVSIVRDKIAPRVSNKSTQTFWRWSYVWKAMIDHNLIIHNVTPTAFGRLIAEILDNISDGAVRKSGVYSFSDGCYWTWREGNPDKEVCRQIAEVLEPLFEVSA